MPGFKSTEWRKYGSLQIMDDDGSWRPATLYLHRMNWRQNQACIYFGGQREYEGLTGPPYTWRQGILRDGDGDVIQHCDFKE